MESVLDTEDPDNGEDDLDANAAAEEQKESNPMKASLLEYIQNMEKEVMKE